MNVDAYDTARATAMIVGYHERWIADMGLYEVLKVEAEFRAPLVNPETGAPSRTWRRGGKLDAIVRERVGGRVLIVEHKTSSEDIQPGSDYWAQLRMDGQVSGYFFGAESLGWKPDACLYDVLGKPKLRPLGVSKKRATEETPEEYRDRCIEEIASAPATYYQRGEVVRLEAEVEEAAFDDWQTAQMLRDCERLDRHPRNPGSCKQWNRRCAYFGVCTGEASLDDPHRFRTSMAHPELTTDQGLPILSASRVKDARACLRLHRFKYIDCRRPIEDADTLYFGSLVHRALEKWWTSTGDRLADALGTFNKPAAKKAEEPVCPP